MRAALQRRIWVDKKLDMNHQCVLTAQRAKHILGCIESSDQQIKEVILHLYTALVRHHLKHSIQL